MHLGITRRGVLAFIVAGCFAVLPQPVSSSDENINWNTTNILTYDVCIIGGGASGTYAAIRLRDMNQSVVIVEQKDRLGGHTETYTDPATQARIDIGVLVWHNLDIVKNFFARFDIPLTNTSFATPGIVSDLVDLRTGKTVTGISPSDPTAALGSYVEQVAQYPYLETGFELPDPVPADLLLPFGEFVSKYDLSAAVNIIFMFNQGIGDLLTRPTIYVMKLFGVSIIQGIQNGFLTTARHDNSELYEKAQASLSAANALLLSSRVLATELGDGSDGYTRIMVSTPSGQKLIRAKKILLTIPPTIKNLDPFHLDDTERSLFSQFSTSRYYTGLLRNSGIPDNIAIQNIAANTPYNLPPLPGVYGIQPTGVPGLQKVLYGSPTVLSDDQVKQDIIASVRRLHTAGTLNTTTPEFAVFSSHSPFEFTVPSSAIQAGFYGKINALQGHRQMFYSGAAFHTQDSSLLWQFTEALLPRVIA
jgi:hypothetical protein